MIREEGALWPVRPHLLPDELLSSWIVRIAGANGLKVQHFSDVVFGNQHQIWNRDIDRLAPRWLLSSLARHTGVPLPEVRSSTLHAYRGRLFRKVTKGYYLRWILPLKIYHRKRLARGLQYCPRCLAGDATPYFRKSWRVAFCTLCPEHGIMLADQCPSCGSPVAFHRGELGKREELESGGMHLCHVCRFDLRKTVTPAPPRIDAAADDFMKRMVLSLKNLEAPFSLSSFDILHQFAKLLVSEQKGQHLHAFVSKRLSLRRRLPTEFPGGFEAGSLAMRHEILAMAAWLFLDLENRLGEAWEQGAIRYNLLLKDFENPPLFYKKFVGRFNRRDAS